MKKRPFLGINIPHAFAVKKAVKLNPKSNRRMINILTRKLGKAILSANLEDKAVLEAKRITNKIGMGDNFNDF